MSSAPGRILGTGLAVYAAVVTALTFQLPGVFSFVGLMLLLFCVELWIDDVRALREAEEAKSERDQAVVALSQMQRELQLEQASASRLPDLEGRLSEAETLISALRAELANPALTLEQLLRTLSLHANTVAAVIRHRLISSGTDPDWPVVEAVQTEDGQVSFRAVRVDAQVDVVGEDVALFDANANGAGFVLGEVSQSQGTDVFCVIDSTLLPTKLARSLDKHRMTIPEGLRLTLAGLRVQPYASMGDSQLGRIQTILGRTMSAVSNALTSVEETEAENGVSD